MPTWQLQTSPPSPAAAAGAIAIVQIIGAEREIDQTAQRLKLAPLSTGQIALRNILDIDRALVVRFAPTSITLFPHGSAAIIRALAQALTSAGIAETPSPPDPRALYPEAATDLEAHMLAALARAASPLAIDLLLDQPRRWAAADLSDPRAAPDDPRHAILRRLITPPLVVAIGPPNIGKSSLLNTLAGRGIALVADEPGTTRDHVGAQIDMAGLVVRYIDTPGMGPHPATAAPPPHAAISPGSSPDADAIQLAAALLRSADLILSCGDTTAPPLALAAPPYPAVLTIATRSDLGLPEWPHDLAVSTRSGHNLAALVCAIRDRLIPPDVLQDPRPWRFF
jgi:hypothetical protein